MSAPLIDSKKAEPKPPQLSILRQASKVDAEAGILDHITITRYKPESLESLCRNTKFTKREIQIMYRGFKQECPTGIVNEDTFKHVYGQFFPQGDSSAYSHYVFKTLDKDNHGCITFEEFLHSLSDLIYGSLEDKLQWVFNLYDQNRDGFVSRTELATMITAIYDMMGAKTVPPIDKFTVEKHVNDIIEQTEESSQSELISYETFKRLCIKDHQPSSTFHEFATDLRLRH
ncbi:Kv channel-interacting protein 4-like isoform X2 [Watersipora subatra]|uniref:Kv channel-interacting protein 4-like isoform X2 n=1 Tax=Watersipora subatra TaxID=2589382 RepID=UPI00355BEC31